MRKLNSNLSRGYVYAPYIISSVIIENSKNINRKVKIGKIFSFDVYNSFNTHKTIPSKVINTNKYGVIPIKKDS